MYADIMFSLHRLYSRHWLTKRGVKGWSVLCVSMLCLYNFVMLSAILVERGVMDSLLAIEVLEGLVAGGTNIVLLISLYLLNTFLYEKYAPKDFNRYESLPDIRVKKIHVVSALVLAGPFIVLWGLLFLPRI